MVELRRLSLKEMTERNALTLTPTDYKSKLFVHPKSNAVVIFFDEPAPNRFIRFWQRILLGWRWEKL